MKLDIDRKKIPEYAYTEWDWVPFGILVDNIQPCKPNARWKRSSVAHMFAGRLSSRSLHEFAQGIGLKREWFQDRATLPHYDLTPKMRAKAIQCGAIAVEDRIVLAVMRAIRYGIEIASGERAGE